MFDDGECSEVEEDEEFYPDECQWEQEEEPVKPGPTTVITEKVTAMIHLQQKLSYCFYGRLFCTFPMRLADILSLPHKVNKETSMDGLPHSASVVRPKERRHDVHQQNPFMRGNTIIRSKTFSPGPQSQYICRVRT